MSTKKLKTKHKPKVKKMKVKKHSKFVLWSIITFTLFMTTSLILLFKSGTGPLQFLATNTTINKITSDGGKSGKKANSTTIRSEEAKPLAKSAKDTLPSLNKPVENPKDTPAPTNNKKTNDDSYDKPVPAVVPTARSQAKENALDKPATSPSPTSTTVVDRTKHDGPMGTSTPTPTPVISTIINAIEGILNNPTPIPATPRPTTTPDPTPTRSIDRNKNDGPVGSTPTPTPKLGKVTTPRESISPATPTSSPTIAAIGRAGGTSTTTSTSSSPRPSSLNSTTNLHAGDQCDDKFFNTIPSCNKCKDQRKIENTLSDGTKITSCQLGEPSVDSIVTSNDLADAQTGLFLDKSKNDGKKCDATDTSAPNYCGKVCKGSTFVMVGSQPSCGIRDIVTEAKYCNGQPFRTWNSNLNECLVATPDVNYVLTPYNGNGQDMVITGYNVSPQPQATQALPATSTFTSNAPNNLEKASIINILNKSKNNGKTCSAGSGLLSCNNLCETVGVIPKDENGNYISDDSGFVFVCQ